MNIFVVALVSVVSGHSCSHFRFKYSVLGQDWLGAGPAQWDFFDSHVGVVRRCHGNSATRLPSTLQCPGIQTIEFNIHAMPDFYS